MVTTRENNNLRSFSIDELAKELEGKLSTSSESRLSQLYALSIAF